MAHTPRGAYAALSDCAALRHGGNSGETAAGVRTAVCILKSTNVDGRKDLRLALAAAVHARGRRLPPERQDAPPRGSPGSARRWPSVWSRSRWRTRRLDGRPDGTVERHSASAAAESAMSISGRPRRSKRALANLSRGIIVIATCDRLCRESVDLKGLRARRALPMGLS
jgi:hypothetical protein